MLLDDALLDEERLIRDMVKKYVSNDVLPLMTDAYEAGRFPKEFIKQTA